MARMSLSEALFGELPDDLRRRHQLWPAEGFAPGAKGLNAVTLKEHAAQARTRPGAPQTPWQLSKDSWIAVVKRTISEISNDRVMSVAAGVTFFGLLALFPAITAFVSIFGLIADQETVLRLTGVIERFLPGDAAQLIVTQIETVVNAPGQSLSLAVLIGLATALYSAMGGAKALIEALNVAWFETETRGFVRLNLVALAFTLGGIALIILMIGVIAVIPAVLRTMPFGGIIDTLLTWLRWPIMIGVLMLALSAIYRWGPAKDDSEWHWITPGAILAAVGLVVASVGFSWYVTNFGSYNATYGSLGAVIVLMMWLWITSMVVMVGAEVNSEVERQIEMENGRPVTGADPKSE